MFYPPQILQSQLASAPDSGTLLGDEALDGSGSGDRPIWKKKNKDGDIDNDDEDVHSYDHDDEEASGSGMGPTTPGKNDSKFPNISALFSFFSNIITILFVSSCAFKSI